jgi:CPA1 family monovalent cation:H+ antiporter
MGQLLLYGAIFSALLILLRLMWMFPGAHVAYFIRKRILHQDYSMPQPKQIFVIGWTGMRGVVALAAAMSLPEKLANGQPFPQRNLIIFLTFSVILVTLVLQGLTLPALIRWLGLAGFSGPNCEEREARRIMAQTALARLEQTQRRDRPEFAPVYDDLRQHYHHRLSLLQGKEAPEEESMAGQYGRSIDLTLELLRCEREAALALRSEGRIDDEVLRVLEHEMDLRETELSLAFEASA